MKSLLRLTQCVLHDMGTQCGVSTKRDGGTVTSRFEHEGLSFLTITLPNFCTDLQKALDRGSVDSDLFPGFARSGGLPKFLSGFLRRVFDRNGMLLDNPDASCIWAMRQITLLHSKIRMTCSPERVEQAFNRYVECDVEVRDHVQSATNHSETEKVRRMAALLFGDVFAAVSQDIEDFSLRPVHGPGAVADRTGWNARWSIPAWTDRLESVFPFGEYGIPSFRYLAEAAPTYIAPEQEPPVRVVAVPKTLKTPRIIAIEPLHMQYMQQGLMRSMFSAIKRSRYAKHFMDPLDQTVNQRLARLGSIDGSLATLDLREASDRVSNQFVESMVMPWTSLKEALGVTRSLRADVPGHGVVPLAKFASMGSAVCFPVEAMAFTTIVFLGIERHRGVPLSHDDIASFVGRVRVFGDDIIVPKEFTQAVVRELESFGHRVNSDKSYWTGRFRESCGKDWYAGVDVSVVKCRSVLPVDRNSVSELVSTVSLRNQLAEAGCERAVDYLDRTIERIIPFPYVSRTSPALGRWDPNGRVDVDRMSPDLHVPQVRAARLSSRSPFDRLEDWGALMKCFSLRGEEPLEEDHLERAGRSDRPRIRVGWTNS